MKVKLLAFAVTAGVVVIAVWGFLAGHRERAAEADSEQAIAIAPRVARIDDLPAVTLDAAALQRSGLVVQPQVSTSHRGEIEAIGTVFSVQELSALRSTQVSAQAQVDATGAAARASAAEYERLRVLHDAEQDVSAKALQAGEASMRADAAAAKAAQAARTAAQQAAIEQWGRPLTEAAATNAPLYARLVTRQEALIQVVLSADAPVMDPPAQARLQVRRGTIAAARLLSAVARTDPRLQGASFLFVAPSAGLVPGSSLSVFVPVGSERRGVLIPASAVVWWQGQPWVYSRHGSGQFVRRALPADSSTESGWFVPGEFAGGEPVVVTGAQGLLSEELRSQVQPGGDND